MINKTNVAIIDADLIGRKKHRFPNLACEKISSYYKNQGMDVVLKTDYENLRDYRKIFISRVFTDTWMPSAIDDFQLCKDAIIYGGTGFYFDKASPLPDEIEHIMPDYSLYDDWIKSKVGDNHSLKSQFKNYTDYSIGFLTRGCFRKCGFCVNKKYDKVQVHSPLEEFYDESRKKIMLLDDNFLGCSKWEYLLDQLIETNKPFCFKQGLDERLLTRAKIDKLLKAKYDGDLIFAFDNIADYDLIHDKLKIIHFSRNIHNPNKNIKFYVLVGYESCDEKDIENAFARIKLLMKYKCIPYIMRYQNEIERPCDNSPYGRIYTNLARWCNQPSFIKKMSFREFCEANQKYAKTKKCSALKSLEDFETKHPDIAKKYFDIKW